MLWSLFPGMSSELFQFLFLWHLQCTLAPLKQELLKKKKEIKEKKRGVNIFIHLFFILKYKTVFKIKYFSCFFFFLCHLILLKEGLWKQFLEFVYTVHMILFLSWSSRALLVNFYFFVWMVVLRSSQGNIISLLVL